MARRLRSLAACAATIGLSFPAWLAMAPAGSAVADTASGLTGIDGSPTAQSFSLVSPAGDLWSFGSGPNDGSMAGHALNRPVVATASTPDGGGYWFVASDGGIFNFGDAPFLGSTGSLRLNQPIVGMAATPDGRGYWLVASDGGIFNFGDAPFLGSLGSLRLNKPIVGMAATPDGRGYWLVAADGGIFNFGDAPFEGSTGAMVTEPAERVVPTSTGQGYWVVDQNGTAWPFGDAGSTAPPQVLLFSPITPGDQAMLFALAQLGAPYVWGGNGPGYDCSGLALASWEHGAGLGFARVADDQYETAGVPVSMAGLVAGDLVFWGNSLTDWTSVYHTALYLGGGQIVDAVEPQVTLSTLDQWGPSQLMPNGRHP